MGSESRKQTTCLFFSLSHSLALSGRRENISVVPVLQSLTMIAGAHRIDRRWDRLLLPAAAMKASLPVPISLSTILANRTRILKCGMLSWHNFLPVHQLQLSTLMLQFACMVNYAQCFFNYLSKNQLSSKILFIFILKENYLQDFLT